MIKTISIVLLLTSSALGQIGPDDFIANFESGNVASVQQRGVDTLTFAIRLDNIPGDTYGWYYFAIAGNYGRIATLYLTNPDGWQNETCSPVVSFDNIHWARVANVWRYGNWVGFRQTLMADTVWFAQDFPFTVTQFYSYIDSIDTSPYVSHEILGYSVHNRPIEMITLTDSTYPDSDKKTVWLTSRHHPMESPPSFMLHGLLDYVLSDSNFARWWRKDIILKVVPIVNVDGVAEGCSRQNAHGINLNRDWHSNLDLEEPEVRAVHQSIENYISSGNQIDMFMDLHAAPDNSDFGFRISLSYSDSGYFREQGTYLHLLESYDPWQNASRWRDLDTNYAFGVSCVVLYDMHELDTYSSEMPWTRREDGSFITQQTLYDQGPKWARAIYDYLYPLTIYNTNESRIDTIIPGELFMPMIRDYDQRTASWLDILIYSPETADSESVVLMRADGEGLFYPVLPIHTNDSVSVPGDGIVTLTAGGEMHAVYVEPGMPSRICDRVVYVGGCDYLPGDINSNGNTNGIDVIYLVNYLKGGAFPPMVCSCYSGGPLYVAGDVNGSCAVNGLDVTYMVNYFKGGDTLRFCPDCPPSVP